MASFMRLWKGGASMSDGMGRGMDGITARLKGDRGGSSSARAGGSPLAPTTGTRRSFLQALSERNAAGEKDCEIGMVI